MNNILNSNLEFVLNHELGYDATRNMNDPCAMARFSVFKVQMADPTGQNIFHIKI
jgi:hypothetical protein